MELTIPICPPSLNRRVHRASRNPHLAFLLISLSLLLLVHLEIISAHAFDTFEHRYLGNTASELLPAKLKAKLKSIEWPTPKPDDASTSDVNTRMAGEFIRKVPFGFGDLPALAGDYADSVRELANMVEAIQMIHPKKSKWTLAVRRQWFNACRWHHQQVQKSPQHEDLAQCFPAISSIEQLDKLLSQAVKGVVSLSSSGYSPTRLEESELERLPAFAELATRNRSHFPQHSWSVYILHHHCAKLFAAKSADVSITVLEECKEITRFSKHSHQRSPEGLLRLALTLEGYAQHFLHDSFSAGHIGAPYGSCFIKIVVHVLCYPTKQLLQHTHDTLSRIGIEVKIPNPPDFLKMFREHLMSPWTAFGDRHLFIPEASFQRLILLRIGLESIHDVLTMAVSKEDGVIPNFKKTCEYWRGVFPIPANDKPPPYSCDSVNPETEDLVSWGPITDWNSAGRSEDARVPDPALEGWKIMATYGTASGNFNELNADGTVREQNSSFDMFTLELGYVRSTGSIWPNYIGFGASILPEIRTSIYPLSWGYWYSPQSRLWFLGLRNNLGVRLEEGLTEENPDNRLRAQVEASVVIDAGVEIYSPIALYVRIEPFSLVVRGLGSGAQGNQATVESFFNGRGAITFGLRFDLANVF